jgi:sirohydrochlorin cobaltochelatase
VGTGATGCIQHEISGEVFVTGFASTAYMLVSHGSRDPRPGRAMDRMAQVVLTQIQQQQVVTEVQSPAARVALVQNVQAQTKPAWSSPALGSDSNPKPQLQVNGHQSSCPGPAKPLVGTGCLELSPIPLHQQIIDFSRRAGATGVKTIRVVPVFLLQGVHVMEDIPEEIHQAQQALPELTIEICPHLGSHPYLKQVLYKKWQVEGSGALVLVAHGSRRAGGNDAILATANALEGEAAFWAVSPKLEEAIMPLIQSGVQHLTILPYFLFAGKITDAIHQAIHDLEERFPEVTFHLLPPLGPTEPMASLVTDLALNRVKLDAQKSSLPLQRTALR